jgi:integrase/recombinase XerD
MDVDVTIRQYREKLQALGYAEATVELYRKNLGQFNRHLAEIGITDLRKVNRRIVLDYKAAVMAQPNSVETKALKLRPVKRLFEHLLASNRLLINPTEGLVETCRKNRKIPPVLTRAEVRELMRQPNLSFAMQIRNRAIMEVLYSTGIRLNELLHLTVHDPDLREKTLFIRKAKGGKQRVVPLGKNAGRYLREYLTKVRPRHAAKRPRERTLFLRNTGEPLAPGLLRQAIRDYRIKAGIQKTVSPHTLRRTCATHMLQQGADIRYIQELLGHSRLTTTQAYTRVAPVEVKKSHDRYHPGLKEAKP